MFHVKHARLQRHQALAARRPTPEQNQKPELTQKQEQSQEQAQTRKQARTRKRARPVWRSVAQIEAQVQGDGRPHYHGHVPAQSMPEPPESHRPVRQRPGPRRIRCLPEAEARSAPRHRPRRRCSQCGRSAANRKSFRDARTLRPYGRERGVDLFHVKHRSSQYVRRRGLCRTHAPSYPCLIGMGRHREGSPRHHLSMRAMRQVAAAHRVRQPSGPHYRRAASLRPWGDRRHACPPDGATCGGHYRQPERSRTTTQDLEERARRPKVWK